MGSCLPHIDITFIIFKQISLKIVFKVQLKMDQNYFRKYLSRSVDKPLSELMVSYLLPRLRPLRYDFFNRPLYGIVKLTNKLINKKISKKQSTAPNSTLYLPRVENMVAHILGFTSNHTHIVKVSLTHFAVEKDSISTQKS